MTAPPELVIRSRRSDLLRFIVVNVKVSAIAGVALGVAVGLMSGDHFVLTVLGIGLVMWLIGVALTMTFAGVAWLSDRNVAISVSDGLLQVRYGTYVKCAVPVQKVGYVGLGPAMTLRSTWTAIEWPPSWPSGLISVLDDSGNESYSITTRGIIIWGQEELERAETSLRNAITTHQGS